MSVHPLIWAGFVAMILGMLLVDLLLFHRESHVIRNREAWTWAGIWMGLGLGFTFVIWAWQGGTPAAEYIAGYLLEKSLSVDNIFVFVLIFSYFRVPPELQYRVLFWGIMGALVFRAAFIALGAALLHRFDFMFYVFGAFLVYTGIRMARHGDLEVHPERNPVLSAARRVMPMTPEYRGSRFFVRENARRLATPLFAVLIVVETTDIVFAVDSIPAIFGITRDPFLVFTSNAFAILGLRALYFLLANMMLRFKYLQLGLSLVLVFIGVKMFVNHWYHVPIWASLGFILVTLTVAVLASLRAEKLQLRANGSVLPPTEVGGGDAGGAQDSSG